MDLQLAENELLKKLYNELEVPLIEVLAEMELNGIGLDVPLLQRVGQEMASRESLLLVERFQDERFLLRPHAV